MALPHPEDPGNPWRRLEEATSQEWFSRRHKTPGYAGPFLPLTSASQEDVLDGVAKMMTCSRRAAAPHMARLVAFGVLKPSGDQVTVDLEQVWRIGEFNRLHYADEYGRFQLNQRGRITEDELLAAARLWARIPDGTQFNVLERSPDEMRPKAIHARILSLHMMLEGLGIWQDPRGYRQPPRNAPEVLSRAALHEAARRQIKAKIAQGTLVARMVVRNQRGLDDTIELGCACGLFKPEARGREGRVVPFYRVDWERLWHAFHLTTQTRVICCPCLDTDIEGRGPDANTWSHFLECIQADDEPHHGGKPIPVDTWDGVSSLMDFLEDGGRPKFGIRHASDGSPTNPR